MANRAATGNSRPVLEPSPPGSADRTTVGADSLEVSLPPFLNNLAVFIPAGHAAISSLRRNRVG
jgi:hypothetical protein